MLRISSLGIWGVTIHKRGNKDLKLLQGHCCNGPAVQDWLQGFGSLLLMLWLWKELHSYLDQPVVVQLQVPSHVLVSKNPVVSWWDVPNSESVIDAFLVLSDINQYVKRHPNGMASRQRWTVGLLKASLKQSGSRTPWSFQILQSLKLKCLVMMSRWLAGNKEDLFLHGSFGFLLHHAGLVFAKFWMPCVLVSWHEFSMHGKNSFRQRSGILTCLTSTGTWGVSFFWRKASAVERWKDCQPQAAFSHWDSDRIDSLCVNLFGAGYAIAWYDPFWWIQQRQPQGLVMTW